ncbi:MAG: hypothetical protein QXT26_02915 [Thermoproteota archaeon]
MVMSCRRLGQARIIEAVMASILLLIVFAVAFYMLFSSEKFFKQEVVDLNRLAYNILHRLAESGIIDEAVSGGQNGEIKLLDALQGLLPQNIYFNLTIYEVDDSGQWRPVDLNGKFYVSNAPHEVFKISSDIASTGIIYTSRNGKTYFLNLVLTRAGLT